MFGLPAKTRIRNATWLILLAVYVVSFGVGIAGVVLTPDAGISIGLSDQRVVITAMEPGSHVWVPGGRVGDVVETINGAPAAEFLGSGGRIESLIVLTGSGQTPKDITIVRSPASLIDESVTLGLLGLSFVLMSLFVLSRSQRRPETYAFAFLSVSAAIAITTGAASVANHPWARLYNGAALYVASIFFFAFFAGFARKELNDQRSAFSWLPEASIVLAIASLIPWALTAAGVIDLWAVLRPGMLVLLGASLLGGTGMLAYRLRSGDSETREQLRIVTLGTAMGLVPFVWLSVVPQLAAGTEIVRGEVSVLGFVLLPLSFGYAMTRHQLMGIRRLVHRGTAYALITAGIIIVYGSALTVVNVVLPDSGAAGPVQIILFVLLLAAAPMLSSVRRRAVAIVDNVLYHEIVEPQDLIRTISTYAASETDLARTLGRSLTLIGEGLGLEYAVILGGADLGQTVQHSYKSLPAGTLDALRNLNAGDIGVRRVELPQSGHLVLVSSLRGIGHKNTSLVLGPKATQEPFSNEDVQLIQTVSGVLTTTITRFQLLAEVQAQSAQLQTIGTQIQSIQEEERAELSSYLHDEPLQKVAYALAQMRERSLPEDLASLLEDVAKDLRSTSASLSPEILREQGLLTAVTWMVEEQKKRGPFNVFLEVTGMTEQTTIGEEADLAIYRAIQEALNNCRKHADAKSVWVRLTRTASTLELAVEDNGVGISSASDRSGKKPEEGLGLRGMKQRISSLGGSLALLPRASRGTAFMVTLPAPSNTAEAAG
jgi:signal transduction histidine kinase